LLSLGPLLVLTVGALEFFLSSQEAREGIVTALRDNVGQRAANTVETVLARVEIPELLAPESILTVALLLFSATAVFRGSLNTRWPRSTSRAERHRRAHPLKPKGTDMRRSPAWGQSASGRDKM
jgi:uncharacterized BrkB/YihY/UPF0761 family membrane protein